VRLQIQQRRHLRRLHLLRSHLPLATTCEFLRRRTLTLDPVDRRRALLAANFSDFSRRI
jgi:hypothetical protein